MKIKYTVEAFASKMREQLELKALEKLPYTECTNLYLMTELEKQILIIKHEKDPIEAARHCVHVANFALFIRSNFLIRGF